MFTIFRTNIFLIRRSVCDRSGRTTPSGLYREALRRKCPALYAFVSLKHCLLCETSHCLCCESHYENCCLHSESCHCLLWWSHQVPTLWVPLLSTLSPLSTLWVPPLSTLCHHCLWLPSCLSQTCYSVSAVSSTSISHLILVLVSLVQILNLRIQVRYGQKGSEGKLVCEYVIDISSKFCEQTDFYFILLI